MWNESNDFSHKNWCVSCKKAPGIHEISYGIWLCHLCFTVRESDKRVTFINWSKTEYVDTLLQAVYYLNYTHKDKPYRSNILTDSLKGDKGTVCYIINQNYVLTDPLGMIWPRQFRYYILYNRKYLAHGDSLFERASMYKGDYQTVRKDVLYKAADQNETQAYKDCVTLAIVMQNKTIWYINPSAMKTFSHGYETERIPLKESSPECSIPITKEKIISRSDPFPPSASA